MKFKTFVGAIFIFATTLSLNAQYHVIGEFPSLADKQIKLIGFNNYDRYTLDSTYVSNNGSFNLHFDDSYVGMAYLKLPNNSSYYVVLDKENVSLKGDNLNSPDSIEILEGKEHKTFVNFSVQHPKRELAYSAWDYLAKIYQSDSLFNTRNDIIKTISKEKERIHEEENEFLNHLDKTSYLSWYLPTRKLITSVGTIAQYRHHKIPTTITKFRELDYTDKKFATSGLLEESIKSHFWLIENSGQTLDEIYADMNISVDALLNNLKHDEYLLNLNIQFLLNVLEDRSLYTVAAYLANKTLEDNTYKLDKKTTSLLERHRSMKEGMKAPNIKLTGELFYNGMYSLNKFKTLYDLKTPYTLLYFGDSNCESCPYDLMQIKDAYSEWKNQGIEVLFISLNKDKQTFKNFVQPFPFYSICDYKGWDSPMVNELFIPSSPTILLLNEEKEIVIRPRSLAHLKAYIKEFIKK